MRAFSTYAGGIGNNIDSLKPKLLLPSRIMQEFLRKTANPILITVSAVATLTAFSAAIITGLLTTLIVGAFAFSIFLGRNFERFHERGSEAAWSLWLLSPTGAAIAATLVARDSWGLWPTLVLITITLPMIMLFAMFMGQRGKPSVSANGERVNGAAPHDGLRLIVEKAPVAAALLVITTLAFAGAYKLFLT